MWSVEWSKKIMVWSRTLICLVIISACHIYAQEIGQTHFESNVFIKNWLICGPFPNEKGQDINTDFLIEHGGEATISPSMDLLHKSTSVNNGTIKWRPIQTDKSGKLDFTKHLRPNQNNVAYAFSNIICPKKTLAILKLGRNDRLKIWLNGKPLNYYPKPGSLGPDSEQMIVNLQAGNNSLLAKVDNIGGGWHLYARFLELISLNDQLYVSSPFVSNVPKKISDTKVADLFSILAYNASESHVGPVKLHILGRRGRQEGSIICNSLAPMQKTMMTAESIVDLTNAKDKLEAQVVVSFGDRKKEFKIKEKRLSPPEGKVYFIQGFHVDPVWRDSQSGYQALSFSNVDQYLRAVEADPDFHLWLHELPYLKPYYDAYPKDRALIRQFVKNDRIETGGSYNQPNETTISGESFIRNILYGRLFHENVLKDSPQTYQPWDVFGHILQLPQILAKSEFIGTTWTRSSYRGPNVRVPDVPDLYWAMSPDGTKLLTRKLEYGYHFDEGGQGYDSDIKMRTCMAKNLFEQQQQIPGIKYDLRLNAIDEKPPTTWFIGKSNEFKYYIPEVSLAADGAEHYFKSVIEQQKKDKLDIPVVSRDVSQYNEGCELSRFDLKMGNRLAENTIITAEKFSTIANVMGADYPAGKLDKAWRQLLYGQHHDGITGCGADVPYLNLTAGYHEALQFSAEALNSALNFIGNRINTQGEEKNIPLIVFNSLNWQRDDIVHKKLCFEQPVKGFKIVDDNGNIVNSVIDKITEKDGLIHEAMVSFVARQVPSIGYRTFFVSPAKTRPASARQNHVNTTSIENDYFRITVDKNLGGGISSLIDKKSGKEYINTANEHPGNELICLGEGPGFEPAWRFLTNGKKSFSKDKSCDIKIFSNPVYKKVIVTGEMDRMKNRIQEITLYNDLQRIDFRTYLVDYKGLEGKNIKETDTPERSNQRDFYVIGFPANLKGSVPVLEDRFATKTYYHSKDYLNFTSGGETWTSNHAMNSCQQWIDYSYSVRALFGPAGTIALGPAEILTTHQPQCRQAGFRLQEALVKRGVPATPGFDNVNRDYDIQYRRFSFSIGTFNKNSYNKKLLDRLPKSQKANFKKRLKENGYAYLFVLDSRLKESWFDLPVLMIVGVDSKATEQAVDKLVDQLNSGHDLHFPATVYAANKKTNAPDYGLAIINRGNMPVSIEKDGTMVLALMHTIPWQSPLLQWTHDFPERKTHVFDYALLPHTGNWQDAQLVRCGFEFNNPLVVTQVQQHSGELPSSYSFFSTKGSEAVITALKPKSAGNEAFTFKKTTDASNGVILRLYETKSLDGQVTVQSNLPVKKVHSVNMMERQAKPLSHANNSVSFSLGSNSIETLLLALKSNTPVDKKTSQEKPTETVYGQYWQQNDNVAPVGYLPVNVRISGENLKYSLDVPNKTVQGIKVYVCNDYIDTAVSGKVKIETPPGIRPVPQEFDYNVDANSEQVYSVALVSDGGVVTPGFIRASIQHDNQTVFDVIEYGLPNKTFGHAEEPGKKEERLEWQVQRKGDDIVVELHNPFSQTIDGKITMISPVESWGLPDVNTSALAAIEPWQKSFSLPAKGKRTLKFVLRNQDIFPDKDISQWAVAKLSYFGYVEYKKAIGNLEIVE